MSAEEETKPTWGFVAFMLFVLAAILFALFLIYQIEIQELMASAVKFCGAYYHPQTGDFTWKECAP